MINMKSMGVLYSSVQKKMH